MKSYYKIFGLIIAAIIIESVAPIPMFLTFGVLYVMLMKPDWFLDFVQHHYNIKQTEEIERMIIECARKNQCRLTVTELAAETFFKMEEAEHWLQKFEVEGRITSEVNERGIIMYNFEELLPRNSLEAGSMDDTEKSRMETPETDNGEEADASERLD